MKSHKFTPTEYLFGKHITDFPDIQEHCKAKIQAGKELLHKLTHNNLSVDWERIRHISKAIEFYERLLDEYNKPK